MWLIHWTLAAAPRTLGAPGTEENLHRKYFWRKGASAKEISPTILTGNPRALLLWSLKPGWTFAHNPPQGNPRSHKKAYRVIRLKEGRLCSSEFHSEVSKVHSVIHSFIHYSIIIYWGPTMCWALFQEQGTPWRTKLRTSLPSGSSWWGTWSTHRRLTGWPDNWAGKHTNLITGGNTSVMQEIKQVTWQTTVPGDGLLWSDSPRARTSVPDRGQSKNRGLAAAGTRSQGWVKCRGEDPCREMDRGFPSPSRWTALGGLQLGVNGVRLTPQNIHLSGWMDGIYTLPQPHWPYLSSGAPRMFLPPNLVLTFLLQQWSYPRKPQRDLLRV